MPSFLGQFETFAIKKRGERHDCPITKRKKEPRTRRMFSLFANYSSYNHAAVERNKGSKKKEEKIGLLKLDLYFADLL